MITKIRVWNYNILSIAAPTLDPEKDVFISIVDPGFINRIDFPNDKVLRLAFNDYSPEGYKTRDEYIALYGIKHCGETDFWCPDYAKAVHDFIDEYHNDSKEYYFNVNCMAGMSRSGAVGHYCQRATCLDDDIEVNNGGRLLTPNTHVLSTLSRYLWGVTR